MPVINKHHHGGTVPPGAVNIMRGSPWGNPFQIGRDGNRAEVIAQHRAWLLAQLRSDADLGERLLSLRDATLCCCCAPAACHGDTLEQLAWQIEPIMERAAILEFDAGIPRGAAWREAAKAI